MFDSLLITISVGDGGKGGVGMAIIFYRKHVLAFLKMFPNVHYIYVSSGVHPPKVMTQVPLLPPPFPLRSPSLPLSLSPLLCPSPSSFPFPSLPFP